MWDWKQLEWVKLVGWDVYNGEKGKFRMLTRLKGLFFFWIIPLTIMGHVTHIVLSLSEGEYRDIVTVISELSTIVIGMLKTFKWAYRGSEIKSIVKDIEELDKRRKKYFSTDNHTDSIMNDHTRTCSTYPYYFFASLLAGFHWIMRPLTSAIHGEYIPLGEDWVPWNDRTLTGWLVHLMYNNLALASIVGGMVAYDTLTLSFNEMSVGLIESISYGLSSLKFENSAVRHRLLELYEMHKDALEITKKLRCFMNFIIQADCLLFTFRMCCGILEITSDRTSSTKKINTIENCMVCAIFFYLQCYKCQIVTAKHLYVSKAAYDNDWYSGTAEVKQNLLIMAEHSKKSIVFGGTIKIDLYTFIAVLKTSFSYYNTLKAIDTR